MLQKVILYIAILVLFITGEPTSVHYGSDFSSHFIFHFYHANIWHLLANASCVYVMKKIRWIEAYLIAVLCSFVIVNPTIGLSGVLFAAIGINIGKNSYTKGLVRCSLSALIFGLLPNVSLLFHLSTLLIGYCYGWIVETWRLYRRCKFA